jgi:hypothetical protein
MLVHLTPMLGDVTDISGVITQMTTYKDAAIALAILILLFVLGRRLVSKLAK